MPITEFSEATGLLGYTGSSLVRFAFGFLAAGIVIYFWKPDFAFYKTENGAKVAKKWKVTAPKDAGDSDLQSLTYFPWWTPGVTAGLLFALLV